MLERGERVMLSVKKWFEDEGGRVMGSHDGFGDEGVEGENWSNVIKEIKRK